MITKRSISGTICVGVLSCVTAEGFLDAIGSKFKEFDKAEITTLPNNFFNDQYDNTGGVRNYSLKLFRLLLD